LEGEGSPQQHRRGKGESYEEERRAVEDLAWGHGGSAIV
jgi:hypothetical protein